MKWNAQYQTYINLYKDLAIEEMLKYHVPASITLAQGLLESRAGLSDLTVKSNNHFGIKCHGWQGATTYHDDDASQECFRAYNNAYESYEDHSKFLTNQQRYNSLFKLDITDYRGWAAGLKACGYATSSVYSQKLIDIIELYGLDQYDNAKGYDHFIAAHAATEKPEKDVGYVHSIFFANKNYYIIAREGDSFSSISKEMDIPSRALARYNERNKNDRLNKGDIVYLKKKRHKAEKKYKHHPHYVKVGESMYSISQLYGMRLKYLYKKNHLSPDYQIHVGDSLIVY
jgi:LysM repeat protein